MRSYLNYDMIKQKIKKLYTHLRNLFTPTESIRQSKMKWIRLAEEDAPYYIWTDKKNASSEEFRHSGKEAYQEYVKGDSRLQPLLNNGKAALEIGCGIGRITEFFIPDFEKVYGVDISPVMIEKAARRLSDSRYVFLEGDGERIPLDSETVDFVFSFIVFQHMPSKKVIESNLAEVYRVLRSGGMAKIQLRGSIVSKSEWFYGPAFSPAEARTMCQRIGFNVLDVSQETDRHLWVVLAKN